MRVIVVSLFCIAILVSLSTLYSVGLDKPEQLNIKLEEVLSVPDRDSQYKKILWDSKAAMELIRQGANPDIKSSRPEYADTKNSRKKEVTALEKALNFRQKDVVQFLINNGAKINDDPILDKAARESKFSIIKVVHRLKLEPMVDGADMSLHKAVVAGDIEEVKAIVEKDVLKKNKSFFGKEIDINVVTKKGYTPLQLAAIFNRVEIIKYLLAMGASPFIASIPDATNYKYTALDVAAKVGNIEAMEVLLEAQNEKLDKSLTTALDAAIWGNQINAARFLLDKGAKISNDDFNFLLLPLIQYYFNEHVDDYLEMAKFLLDNGADSKDILRAASYHWRIESLELLKPHIVDFEKYKNKMLYYSTGSFDQRVVKWFLDNGADVNYEMIYKDSNGNEVKTNVMAKAISDSYQPIIRLLIDAGANLKNLEMAWHKIEPYNEDGVKMIKMLIAAGVNPDVKDKDRKTLLDKLDKHKSRRSFTKGINFLKSQK